MKKFTTGHSLPVKLLYEVIGEKVIKLNFESCLLGSLYHPWGTWDRKYKLVNKSLPADQLTEYVDQIVQMLLTSGPAAITYCKNLIDKVVNHIDLNEALTYTAQMIAEIRASAEGQEGMAAFLEKRKPGWVDWMYQFRISDFWLRISRVISLLILSLLTKQFFG